MPEASSRPSPQPASANDAAPLSALLGLAAPGAPLDRPRVNAARWEGDHLTVEVEAAGAAPTLVHLHPAATTPEAFSRTDHVAISHDGSSLPEPIVAVLQELPRQIADVTLEALRRALGPAPEPNPDAGPLASADAIGATTTPSCVATNTEVADLPDLFGVLGPDDSLRGTRLNAAQWWGGRLLVEVEAPDTPPLSLFIEARRPDRPAYRTTAHLAISHENREFTPALVRALDAFLPRLEPLTIEQLSQAFPRPPHFAIGDGDDNEPGTYNADDSVTRRWRGLTQWRRFFASRELDRNVVSSLRLSWDTVYVDHGDRECNFAYLMTQHWIPRFVNYPWRQGNSEPDADREVQTSYTTDMSESDAVMGGLGKLEQLLDGVKQKHRGQSIRVNVCCLPMVIADDFKPAIEQFAADHDQPVVLTTQETHQPMSRFAALVRARFPQGSAPPTDDAVNLVGFGREREFTEITELLARAGVRVNVGLLPHANASLVEQYPRARVQVFCPSTPWQSIYDLAFRKLPLMSVWASPPFGIEGMKRWLAEVAGPFAREAQAAAAWERARDELWPAWSKLAAVASRERLGVVVDRADLRRMLSPASMMGVPLLAMLDEMGFGLDVFCYGGEYPCLDVAERALAELPGASQTRHRAVAFETPEELGALMRDSAAHAFYSEYFFDRRLTEAGKSQFSLDLFEKGMQGALRTLEHLVDLSRASFYRRYAQYLS